MGLINLIAEVEPVFAFFRDVWAAFPVAIQALVLAAFGGVIYISALRSVWR